jgi:hypothetical protein
MVDWADVEREEPEFAARVRRSFDAGKHKTLATLRRDGAPRISGTELDFFDGHAYLGSMLGAVKARDLLRDPRCALHSATVDTELTGVGDAKVSGRAVAVTDPAEVAWFVRRGEDQGRELPPDDFHLFRLDVDDVSLLTMGDPPDHLVIEHWKSGRGLTRTERK